jgi:hypothetical protein
VEQPGAEVVHQRQPLLVGEGREGRQRRLLGRADDAEVGPVDLEEQRGVVADGGPVVRQPRPVGGPDLDQPRAGGDQQVRQPVRPAELEELAAADDHLAAGGDRGDDQHQGGGPVVDHRRGLGPAQLGGQRAEVGVREPRPPLARSSSRLV